MNYYLFSQVLLTLESTGMFTNLICLVVLTRPQMRSPINFLLASLAVVDFLGLGFSMWSNLIWDGLSPKPCLSRDVAVQHFIAFLSSGVMVYGMNSWLTSVIAVTRYVVVTRVSVEFTMIHAQVLVFVSVIPSVIQYIPEYLWPRMSSRYHNSTVSESDINKTCFQIDFLELNSTQERIYAWYKFVFTFIPCLVLVIFSVLLVSVILKGRKQHVILRGDSWRQTSVTSSSLRRSSSVTSSSALKVWRRTTRTTTMLLALSVSSVISRSPIIALMVLAELERMNYFVYIQYISYVLVDINSGLNLIFFVISKEFRITLKHLFRKRTVRSSYNLGNSRFSRSS